MTAEFIIIILLAITEAVLWIIPSARRNNGKVFTAFKTVPIGFIVLLASSSFFSFCIDRYSQWKMENIYINPVVQLSIPIVLSIVAVIISGVVIRRIAKSQEKYSLFLSVGAFFFFLPVLVVLSGVLDAAVNFNTGNYRGKWHSIWFELDTRKIAFEYQAIHPFLAEYNYRLCFVKDGKTFRQMLFVNCGGRTHFNIYRLKDGRYLFQDKDFDYLVDLSEPQVSMLRTHEGKLYAGVIPNEEVNSWSFPHKDAGGKILMGIGRHTVETSDVTGILENKEYYGCVQRKFYPASTKAETAIKFMRKR